MSLRVPVRVQGRDPDGAAWVEMTTSEDTSPGGISLLLRHPTRVGQALHMSLPLPKRFRRYDLTDPSYRIYGLVRHVVAGVRVGVVFLGKHPPRGAEALPAGLFLMPDDPRPPERREYPRYAVVLALRLEGQHARGAEGREEQTVAENLSRWGAQVKTSLPVAKGEMLVVEEVHGAFKTRAEIRNVSIGPDGAPRLNLLFLDEPAPDRLLVGGS